MVFEIGYFNKYKFYCFQNDDSGNFKNLIEAIKESKDGKTLGIFAKDTFSGPFVEAWKKMVKSENFQTVLLHQY